MTQMCSHPDLISQQQQQELLEIKIEMASYTPFEASSSKHSLYLPTGDLLARRDDYLGIGVPLYEASVKGDWETAQAILTENPKLVRYGITENYDTALHIAASAKSTKLVINFVRNLVILMTDEDLELQNRNANTAFSLAAAAGNVGITKILVEKNPRVVNISGTQGPMPLSIACLYEKYEMVEYLYDISNMMNAGFWNDENRGWVLEKCVEADLLDVAFKMVKHKPELAINGNLLQILARKKTETIKLHPIGGFISRNRFLTPYINKYLYLAGLLIPDLADIDLKIRHVEKENQRLQLLKLVWSKIVKRDDILRGPADIAAERVKYSSNVLFIAAEMGNTKFIVELIRQYPDLIWQVNDKNQSIFHVAVSHRQEGIYNLLYEIGSLKDRITSLRDVDGNNMLHVAGMRAKNKRLQDIPGVALQMQRELLWYKEVEGMVPPSYREMKNKDGRLPHELFTEEHKDLLSASEKWMKDTASQSMVVAALIATVVFAAAFTIPGGYNQDNGIPILRRNRAFLVFVISDAISLAFATSAILLFLHIHTSRYAEKDFLESLPKKLAAGLAGLSLSITTMIVAFSASFFVLYDKELIWVPLLITFFLYMPVIFYNRLYSELLADALGSRKKLFNPEKPVLYY